MTFSNADLEAGLDRPRRRVFSVEYKLALLEEYYRLTEPGAKNALLRAEVGPRSGWWLGSYGAQ
jgi:hypothetical protein